MTEDAKIITAKMFASKYEKPMLNALRNSCPQIAEMPIEDIKIILCICLGLGPMLSDKEYLSHECVEDIVECAIILAFLWEYKYPTEDLFSGKYTDDWIINSINDAKNGAYGEIPGTQMMIEVVTDRVEIPISINIPTRKITRVVKQQVLVPTEPKTYLMIDGRNGRIKIGKSVHPKARERTLQSEVPETKLWKVYDKDVEKILHKHFAEKRYRGEWFDLTQEDIDWICKEYDFKEP